MFGEGLGKIFGGLSFSGTCRSSRSTSKVELERPHQSHVTLVSERSDNKPQRVPQILIPIREVGLNAPDVAVIINPVIPELADPFKGGDVLNVLLHHFLDHVLRMHIDNDQGVYCYLLLLC